MPSSATALACSVETAAQPQPSLPLGPPLGKWGGRPRWGSSWYPMPKSQVAGMSLISPSPWQHMRLDSGAPSTYVHTDGQTGRQCNGRTRGQMPVPITSTMTRAPGRIYQDDEIRPRSGGCLASLSRLICRGEMSCLALAASETDTGRLSLHLPRDCPSTASPAAPGILGRRSRPRPKVDGAKAGQFLGLQVFSRLGVPPRKPETSAKGKVASAAPRPHHGRKRHLFMHRQAS